MNFELSRHPAGRRSDHRSRPARFCAGVAALSLTLGFAALVVEAQEAGPLLSVKEIMEKTITPATNTIWNAYEPPSDEAQWLALEEAAVTLIVAAEAVGRGGSGPMDNEWAQNPAYQAFNQVVINAGVDALAAIRARDHDALLTASDVLYPPCEGCHLQFNPGVVNAQ
jgi:cytochrome c556